MRKHQRRLKRFSLIAFTLLALGLGLLIPPSAAAQDIDGLLVLLEAGERDSVSNMLSTIRFDYPGHPGVRYVDALLQTDALVAAGLYKDIIRNHGKSNYAAPSLMRLGEYYYAQGLYIQSRQHLVRLMRQHHDFPEMTEAVNLLLRAGVAARRMDSLYIDLTYAIKAFPDAFYDLPGEVDVTRLPPGIRPAAPQITTAPTQERPLRQLGSNVTPATQTAPVPAGKFTLQAGAFSSEANANRLADQIRGMGYVVEVRPRVTGDRALYLIWVGRYSTREEASRTVGLLESALGIQSFPVEVP